MSGVDNPISKSSDKPSASQSSWDEGNLSSCQSNHIAKLYSMTLLVVGSNPNASSRGRVCSVFLLVCSIIKCATFG